MPEIDSNVKRPVNYGQPRIDGQFFKSGCSVAPSPWPKLKPSRGNARHNPHNAAEREPVMLTMRKLAMRPAIINARNQARAMGIPSYTKN